MLDGDESDVDCGGSCTACDGGRVCSDGPDCLSGECDGGLCLAPPRCNDQLLNGTESDIDCGGSCARCPLGKVCRDHADCSRSICTNGVCSPMPPPSPMTLAFGPLTVPPGAEDVQCVTLRLPNTNPVDIVQLETTFSTGIHHFSVYVVTDNVETPAPQRCGAFFNVTGGARPLTIANHPSATLQFPSGVAYPLGTRQMIRIEAHYLNATAGDLTVSGSAKFVPGAEMTYQEADFMFCGSVSALACPAGGLPPGMALLSLLPDYFNGGSVDLTQLTVFGLTSHQHHLGTNFQIWKATGNYDPAPLLLYANSNWRDAPLITFDDAHDITFAAGEGLRWQCSYDTTSKTEKTCFGEETENDEMCFLAAYYYPSRRLSDGDCWR
jgi:hypothetical protein